MSHVVSCPTCSRQLRVPDNLIGETVQCANCKGTFTAEPPAPSPPRRNEDDDVPRPSRSSSRRDEDDDDDDRPRRRSIRRDEDDDGRRSRRRRLAPHRGDTIQIMGILSFFFAPLILGPVTWVMGNNDLREMDAGRMDPAGRGSTQTGRMCAMISTCLSFGALAIGFLAFGACCCMGSLGNAGGGGGGPPPPVRRF